jgi:hypothetical protein
MFYSFIKVVEVEQYLGWMEQDSYGYLVVMVLGCSLLDLVERFNFFLFCYSVLSFFVLMSLCFLGCILTN